MTIKLHLRRATIRFMEATVEQSGGKKLQAAPILRAISYQRKRINRR